MNSNDSAAKVTKTYNISLVVNVKRGKEEIEMAKSETAALYNLIATDIQTDWAKVRIEGIHTMIFSPNGDQIKADLEKKLAEVDSDQN